MVFFAIASAIRDNMHCHMVGFHLGLTRMNRMGGRWIFSLRVTPKVIVPMSRLLNATTRNRRLVAINLSIVMSPWTDIETKIQDIRYCSQRRPSC